MGPDDIRTYQVYLVQERKLAPSSLEIAVCALRFLFKVTLKQPWTFELIPAPKKPRRLPVVLSPDEVVQFLARVAGFQHRAILTTCDAAGRACPKRSASAPPISTAAGWSSASSKGKGGGIVTS